MLVWEDVWHGHWPRLILTLFVVTLRFSPAINGYDYFYCNWLILTLLVVTLLYALQSMWPVIFIAFLFVVVMMVGCYCSIPGYDNHGRFLSFRGH